MEKTSIIELTNKLYKISLLFPKKEPLRYKAREAAIDILEKWVLFEDLRTQDLSRKGIDIRIKELVFEIEQCLDVLNSYLEVAKWQNWVSFFEVLDIQKEYEKIRLEIKEKSDMEREIEFLIQDANQRKLSFDLNPETAEEKATLIGEEVSPSLLGQEEEALEPRKRKIMDFLQEKGKVQVQEIKEIMPLISKRTLRRDFQYLLKKGIIERMGEKNNTFYQIRGTDNDGTGIDFTLS